MSSKQHQQRIVGQMETITPAMATKMLEHNSMNRNLIQERVARYAQLIRNSEWLANGESIIIASDGNVLDGQHRLWAIIEADMSIEIMVVRGVNPDTYATIDTGAQRSAAHAITIAYKRKGLEVPAIHVAMMASACRLVMRYKASQRKEVLGNIHNAVIMNFLDANPGITECVKSGMDVNIKFKAIPISAVAALKFLVLDADASEAEALEEFLARLADGVNLEANSPILRLRNQLVVASGKKISYSKDSFEILAMGIRAYSAYRNGKILTHVVGIVKQKRGGKKPTPPAVSIMKQKADGEDKPASA